MKTNNRLREAVKKLLDALYDMGIDENTLAIAVESPNCQMKSEHALSVLKEVRAALAEPVRNYEVGTAEEQAKRMDDFCARHGERIGCSWRCDNCPLCSIERCDLVWAHMPYVEKKGGRE